MSAAATTTRSLLRSRTGQAPIGQLAGAVVALVVSGGIYLAAHLPAPPSLAPAVGLVAAAGALLVVALVLLARLRDFAWQRFFLVARWTLVAYVVEAGMLEYVFVLDHVRGGSLAVLTAMLVLFALDIPLLVAFSVARHQQVGGATGGLPAPAGTQSG